MRLEKWYADVVTRDGPGILYRANLSLGLLTLGYAAELDAGGRLRSRIGMGSVGLPWGEVVSLHWPAAGPESPAVWHGPASRPEILWADGVRKVTWDPVVTNGEVTDPDGKVLGRGYAERLVLDLPPWALGLDRLRWGRFCGRRHSLVWIEWQGRRPGRWARLDGLPALLREAGPDAVVADGARLAIGPGRTIVGESLGTGALAVLGPLKYIAAPRFLAGVERKWFAAGELDLPGGGTDAGHVIHEEVTWT